MPVTQGFNHIATMTADLDRLIKFYADAFGGEVTFEITKTDDHPRMANIELGGGAGLNVFEVPNESIIGERRTMGGRGPIDHFGIAVDSRATLEEMREQMVAGRCGDRGDQRRQHLVAFFRPPMDSTSARTSPRRIERRDQGGGRRWRRWCGGSPLRAAPGTRPARRAR